MPHIAYNVGVAKFLKFLITMEVSTSWRGTEAAKQLEPKACCKSMFNKHRLATSLRQTLFIKSMLYQPMLNGLQQKHQKHVYVSRLGLYSSWME